MKKRLTVYSLFFLGLTGLMLADSTPDISRVYGDPFATQVNSSQSQGAIGTLVPTGVFGTDGSLNINTQLSGSTAQAIQVLSDGTFVVALSASTSSVLAKYSSNGTIQTTAQFGTDGVVALGAGTTSTARAIMLDTQGRILTVGGAASGFAGWLVRVSADGDTVQTFDTTTGTPWQFIGNVAQQSDGKIITVGFDGTNAQIGRYTLGSASAAGVLDTDFGGAGFTTLDGSGSLPEVVTGLYSVVIDATDRIYVAFIASGGTGFTSGDAYIARFTANGTFDTTWGASGVLNIPDLDSATSGLYLAQDVSGNFIVAAQVSPNVKVAGVTSSGGSIGGFTTFNTSTINGNTYAINNLITTSDNKIYIVGSNSTTVDMAIMRLNGSSGTLDTTFNNTAGYNFFNPAAAVTSITASVINSVSVAPTGQLYTVGYQTDTGTTPTTQPYVSVLYNNAYVSQVAQDPATTEQGNLDLLFGNTAVQTYAGVVTPFNGLYGPSLMQQAYDAIEIRTSEVGSPSEGDILVGMSGYTDSSSDSSMMFAWLDSTGAIDTSVNSGGSYPGYLTLTHDTTGGFSTSYPHEYLSSMYQGVSGIVYVAGWAATSGASTTPAAATLRAYSTSGTITWTVGNASFYASEAGANYKGLAVGTQSSSRILLFVQDSATTGHISGYTTLGALDTGNFGLLTGGSPAHTGMIPTSNVAYPNLAMGPVYGGVVLDSNNIVVAYKNSGSAAIDVAMFVPDGSALQTSFGSSGIVSNIFSGATITLDNVRVGFQQESPNKNILVIGATATELRVASLSQDNGVIDYNTTITITGATALKLKEVTGVSDGTALITFYDDATDDVMYTARVTNTCVLDTTYNSQGSQPGVLPIQIGDQVTNYHSRILNSALVQSTAGANQGNVVLAGYQSVTSSDSTSMVMRSYGEPSTTELYDSPISDSAVPGTFLAGFDLENIFGNSAGKVVYAYPAGNTYAGMMLVGVDNGTNSYIARIDVSSQTLDASFGSSGVYTITGLPGINCLTVDANNYILAGGTTSAPLGWACQITPSATGGTPQVNMTMPTGGSISVTGVNKILQQKSGRYIIAGRGTNSSAASINLIMAFQDKIVSPATTLAIDPTFNPNATGGSGSVNAGSYSLGTTNPGCYSIALNTDDTILAATVVGGVVVVTNITADGSGNVTTFASGSPLTTTVAADSNMVARVAIDSTGKVVVAASNSTGTVVSARRYTSTGANDTTWNSTGAVLDISNVGTAGVALTDMMQTTTQQTVLVGYNTAGGNGRLFAARLSSAGILDSTWNPSPTGTDTAGVLTYTSDTTPLATTLSDAAITLNGNIVSVGSSNSTAGDPIITFVYGDTYVTEQAQQPLEAAAGTLDTTIPGGSSGAWSMTTIPAAAPQKIYIYNTTINSSANGAMLIAASNGTDSYVTQLNSDLSVNSANFGSSGIVTISGKDNVHDMFIANGTNDTSQPIYVTGDSDGLMWASLISSNGATTTTFTSAVSGSIGRVIRQTSNNRILIAGFNGTNACIYALNNDLSAVDSSFGDAGSYVVTGVTNEIYAMTIDQYDRIYIAYQVDANTINVQRILANGTGLDTTFNTTGTQTMTGTAWSATQIRLVLDMTNNILTVVAQDGTGAGNTLKVARFSTAVGTSGNAVGTANTMTIAGKVLNLSDVFVDNQTNPDLYVIGYNSTDNYSVVGRFTTTATTITLDTTYATASTPQGVANVAAGSMTVVNAGALDPDRRVYLVGTSGTASTRYMARLFGDVYTTQKTQATFEQIHGQIDLTVDGSATTPDGGLVLSALTGWSGLTGYTAQAIIANADGTSYIAFGNGTNLIVGQVDADMNPVTSFDTDGLTTALTMATVGNMSVDSLGNIFVAGTQGGAQKVVGFSSAGALVATGATTLSSTVGTAVAQQKSGRYIIGGKIGSSGVISAYKNLSAVSGGILPVDPTFGPATLDGYYQTGVNAQVDSLVIDSQDYIYIVYRDASNHVTLEKITADGSGKVSSANSPTPFNGGAAIDTGIVATGAATIAINSLGNIIVGAPTAAGVYTGTYNGSTGAIIGATTQQITATAGDVLTRVVGAGTGFYGVIYNSTPTIKVFHVLSSGLLDSTATAGGTGFGTSGIATFTGGTDPETSTVMNGITVQPDGKVTMVGRNNQGTASGALPTMMRVYGYQYIPQYTQQPNQAGAGILDTTLWPTTGALALDTYSPISTTITEAILTGSSVSRIYEYSNGQALLVFSGTNSGADTIVARINKDLTLDTTGFNSAGTQGYVTITGQTNANALFVNEDGQIFVAGGSGATSWLRAYNEDGTVLTGWTNPTTNLANGAYQVLQQSLSRVILAGKAGTNGSLYGYTTAGTLDATFGSGGVVDMGSTQTITDITLDYYNDIIAVSTAGTTGTPGAVVLKKVDASGVGVTTLSGGTAVANSTGNPKVIMINPNDVNSNIVVASATTNGFTIARYNNDATGTNNGAQLTIAAGGSNSSVLGNIYATSDGKVVLVGYETIGDTVVVARIASDFTFDTDFGTNGVLATTVGSVQFLALDGMICADNRIMIAGGSGAAADPYLARSFGDDYVTYVTQAPTGAVLGTLDTSWGVNGIYDYSGAAGITVNSTGQSILATASGGYYMALTNGTNAQVVRTVASGALDTTFGGGDGIAAALTSFIPTSMMIDGSNRLVLTSTQGGAGKIARYVSGDTGDLDTNFNSTGVVTIGGATEANALVEQTLGRYVVAGKNGSGAVLYAYTALQGNQSSPGLTGVVDTTFGNDDGYVQINSTNGIYNLIADQYDRLIFAVLNSAGNGIDLYRLTPTGQFDATFGAGGKVANVFTTSNSGTGVDASSIRVALDSAGNIVVAAYVYTSGTSTANITIAAYDNGTSTTAGGNGALWTNPFAIPNVVALSGNATISLTDLVATADEYVLVQGNGLGASSITSPTWIARLANTASSGTYALDSANFNPAGLKGDGTSGGIAGIFEYANTTLGDTTPYNVYNDMVVGLDGRIAAIGYEQTDVAAPVPTVIRVYDTPYTTQEVQSPNSKVIGTNDITLGVSPTFAANLGVTFYGITGGAANYGQVARAIALQDYDNIVVAVDGGASAGGASQIFMTKFDTDGILNPDFNITGQATVLSTYSAQNVTDMVTFTTADAVHKAILAGYVTNATLSSTDSLLLQYNLDTAALDTTNFGGYNGNPQGIAFGDGQRLNSVARQTNGRIIAAGSSQDNVGLLLGYTAGGKLDESFAQSGYLPISATASLYTHAVDTQNRVVVAYRTSGGVVAVARYLADGSGLDTSFGTGSSGIFTTGISVSDSSNIKIALNAANVVIIAAVTSGTTVSINSYNDASAGTVFTPALSLTAFTLAKLLVDVDGKAVIVGSDTNGVANDQIVIARTNTTLSALDTTFNPDGTQGYLKYAVASGATQIAQSAMIHPDGRILIVGAQN